MANAIQRQTLLGAGVVLLALALAYGAWDIPSDSGYAGVGPNFLPWLVALALLVCGAFLVYEARTGGFRAMQEEVEVATTMRTEADAQAQQQVESTGQESACFSGFCWMSAGMLLNATLITTMGFILSCTLCFVMASHGLRLAQGKPLKGMKTWVTDGVIGLLIAAPVYWLFTKFLAINLPGLTQSGLL